MCIGHLKAGHRLQRIVIQTFAQLTATPSDLTIYMHAWPVVHVFLMGKGKKASTRNLP